MVEQKAVFTQGNLFRHITVMSVTSSVGLMAIFFVDLVDMIFISMLGKAELAAAVGYAGAVLFFTTSFGIGMAIAAGALVARALGANDTDEARRRATNSLVYGVVFGAVFAAVVWYNLDFLVSLLGATGETRGLAVHYLQIIVPSLPFLMIGMIGGAILRAHGDARRAMMATIWGGTVNAVLDPILIFGLDLELTGAALASVAARLTIAGVALLPLVRNHGGLDKPSIGSLHLDLRPILAIALPAILTQLATPIGQAYVTRAMAEYGEEAVAGMAIIARITPVGFGIIFALSGAIGPVIGQNAGAGLTDRVSRAFRDGIIFTALVVIIASTLFFLARPLLASVFELDGIALSLVFLFAGPLSLMFFFNGVLFVANAAFNNLGRPLYSTILNWGRHTLGTIPFVMVGAAWYGAPGVLIGQYVGGAVFAVLALVLARRVLAEQGPRDTVEPFARQARLFSLFNRRH
ncbi:MATE family efflux transporter [Yoonia sediminilitoris]|uniref:Putative MATE family efflux protein n=1 Tax=Yoonia sediminilitoris TaxID=1286148 RepID=A0A2T6KFU8_9RHOB|nr:MATE family efflux transporter [Yoonia sediminilitoris]PUB14203.1 putative MATE family efflux protein [Yoonia sediminilitoris]RCW95134.1 putative MATE family efflux protein [Yoonia sediminilitoris]